MDVPKRLGASTKQDNTGTRFDVFETAKIK